MKWSEDHPRYIPFVCFSNLNIILSSKNIRIFAHGNWDAKYFLVVVVNCTFVSKDWNWDVILIWISISLCTKQNIFKTKEVKFVNSAERILVRWFCQQITILTKEKHFTPFSSRYNIPIKPSSNLLKKLFIVWNKKLSEFRQQGLRNWRFWSPLARAQTLVSENFKLWAVFNINQRPPHTAPLTACPPDLLSTAEESLARVEVEVALC